MPRHLAEFTRSLPDEAATLALGRDMATGLTPGLVIYLVGELGAGKTTLVRGLLRGLGFSGRVKSPTFALIEAYTISRLYLYHFDFYRFTGSSNLHAFRETGFSEHFDGQSVCIVEWPERVGGLPPADLTVVLEVAANKAGLGRTARLHADSEAGASCLKMLTIRDTRDRYPTP
jgi:tRNA threonylcarbamoyladenosine biosynthesis protein TsaE